jgi:hypothetical protein
MPTLPKDLSTQTNEQIDTLIQQMITYYDTNSSSFTGADGLAYAGYIPTMVTQLQQMVLSNPATNLQEAIDTDTTLDFEILEAKEDMKIAEERVKIFRQKDKKSYYESWFPLNRPLRTSTNITLIGVGIFFFVFSFLVFLSAIGFSFNINTTWAATSTSFSINKLSLIFLFGYGTTLLFIGLIILIIVGYLRST